MNSSFNRSVRVRAHARALCALAATVLGAWLAAAPAVQAQLRPAEPAEQAAATAAFRGVEESLASRYTDVQSVVVALRGRIVYRYYRDGAPEALRDQQSVIKSALSVLAGIAVGQGRLTDLDQPVLQRLPEWAGLNADPRAAAITVRHLLTMTAGFQLDARGTASGSAAAAAWSRPLAAAPGSRFGYDNGSIPLLSAVLEKATGLPIAEYARLNLVEPLGLAAPNYERGLHLRTEDMARIGWLMLRQGAWEGRQLLPAAYVAEAVRAHTPGGPPVSLPYGYLWWVASPPDQPPTYFASGSGGQLIWVHAPLDLVVAATSTVSAASQQRGQILQLLRGGLVPAAAQLAGSLPAPVVQGELKPVRGVVQSISQQGEAPQRTYIRLKLDVLKEHSRFPTITYRVPDRRLVDGLKPGDPVAFTAQQAEGEPTLVAIERAAR